MSKSVQYRYLCRRVLSLIRHLRLQQRMQNIQYTLAYCLYENVFFNRGNVFLSRDVAHFHEITDPLHHSHLSHSQVEKKNNSTPSRDILLENKSNNFFGFILGIGMHPTLYHLSVNRWTMLVETRHGFISLFDLGCHKELLPKVVLM